MPNLLIGPYKEGLVRNVEPFLLPNDAFPILEDAYLWRGRIKKKEGYSFVGRLHREAPTLPDSLGKTADTIFMGTIAAANLPISPGTVTITTASGLTFTDYQAAPSGRLTPHYNGIGTLTTSAPNSNYGTIDYNTGAITLTFNPGIGVSAVNMTAAQRLERLPVMDISTHEQPEINRETTLTFDEDYSYDYNIGTGWFRDVSLYKKTGVEAVVQWTGDDSDFFWTTNYYNIDSINIFWATNNVSGNHGRAITAITQAANAIITIGAGHTFIVGDVVFINENAVGGMVEINGLTGTVSAVGAATITVNIASAAFAAYTAGGVAFNLTQTLSGDGVRYYDGYNPGTLGWRNFSPPLTFTGTNTDTYLRGALILIPYRDRLVALNTIESTFLGADTRYSNRARWCQNGTPFYATSLTPAAATTDPRAGSQWADNIVGKGGYNDAPTTEAIVSAAFIKDTLIVFFEKSTWQLRYSGNELLPFIWEKINSELGCESTFSPIQHDKQIFAIGDKRIIATNSIDVEPIDQKIPDEVFSFHNDNEGHTRVHGIRDFFKQMDYWTFPDAKTNPTFPDRVLALNYEEQSFSIFKNSFTCFGGVQFSADYTWATLPYPSWANWNVPWGSPLSQSYFPDVVAGNQRGFVLNLSTGLVENAISLDLVTANSITNATPPVVQITNHNLQSGQFVKITNVRGFGVDVVDEAIGDAVLGSTSFTGTLDNLGVFPSTVVVTIGANVFTDIGDGTFHNAAGAAGGTITYESGDFTVNFAALAVDTAVTANYTYNILNFRNFYINRVGADTFSLYNVSTTGNLVAVALAGFGAAYDGSGQISVIDNYNIKTKRFSPFIEQDTGFRMNYLDLLLNTNAGHFNLSIFEDQVGSTPVETLDCSSDDYLGKLSNKHWSRFFPNVRSEFIQLQFTMSDYQMTDTDNTNSDFQLHAMSLKVEPSGRL